MKLRQFWMLAASLGLFACSRDYGTGGTGEIVVPPERLRVVDATPMARIAETPPTPPSTAPTTVPTTLPAARPAPLIELTIEEVRQLALQHNLDLRVELLNPTIARQSVTEEEAAFESVFTTSIVNTQTDSPTATRLQGTQAKDLTVTPGIQIPLRTGGVLRLDAPVDRLETNNAFSLLNPAYTSDLAASISHPLLRNAGIDVNAHRIRVAFYHAQQTEARTKLEVTRVLANADRAYWRLDAARRLFEVRKTEYNLAVAQLERSRRVVAQGKAAEVDVLRAESAVADRIEAVITAENQVRDRQRELKRILNKPGLEMDNPTIIVPVSRPNPLYYELNAQRLMQVALDQRMEMLETELQMAEETANVRFARNQMLPLVNVDYTYGVNGLGPSLQDAFDMTGHRDFEDHRVGLRVEVPIGNEAARSRLRAALARRMQALRTRDARTQLIRHEVLIAIDQIELNWQRILAAQRRVILAARVLDAEIRQYALGLRTSTDVSDAQARLADAQAAEIAAITEYQIAQVDIAFATGTLLGASKVVWEPVAMPRRP